MKTILLIKTFMLVAVIAICSVPAFAQLENEHKQIPEGKWVLESVSAFEENVQIPFSMDSIGFEVPTEMDMQQDELTFVYKEVTEKVKYDAVAKASSLCFPVCTEWSITGNKLQLQWGQDIDNPSGGTKMRTVTLNYARK